VGEQAVLLADDQHDQQEPEAVPLIVELAVDCLL
jgi:hypothetical protein